MSRTGKLLGNVLCILALATLSFTALFPVVMGALSSLKTDGEITDSVLSLPNPPHWENYSNIAAEVDLANAFKNNLIITAVAVAGIVLFSSLAGYKLSRTPGKLSKAVFLFIWSSMLIPFHSIMFPLVSTAQKLHIKDILLGIPLIYIGLGVNFAIFLYHGFVKNVPREMEEAAMIDGCGQLKSFWLVVFPLLLPITMTVVILDVLWVWNDFLMPVVMISKYQNYTLVLIANSFFGTYVTAWEKILPILILTSLPVIVFYLFFQRYIVKGIADGAVKG